MTIGPTHYAGYTCNGCKFLKETTHWYCFDPSVTKMLIDNNITDRQHTPKWCPYLKLAIMEHVMEDY